MNRIYIIMNITIYIFIVGIMGMLPFISRKTLAFGVTIPASAFNHTKIKAVRKWNGHGHHYVCVSHRYIFCH